MLGFGYEGNRNDFKVARLTYVQGFNVNDKLPPIVEVFSLCTGSWREIRDNPLQRWVTGIPRRNAFVDGKVYWIAYGMEEEHLIQVFDISDEAFKEMLLPKVQVTEKARSLVVSVYEESIAFFHSKENNGDTRCCIWVKEEYGVREPWTKIFNGS